MARDYGTYETEVEKSFYRPFGFAKCRLAENLKKKNSNIFFDPIVYQASLLLCLNVCERRGSLIPLKVEHGLVSPSVYFFSLSLR